MARFPSVEALASAPVADVLRAWAGLGYNRRAVHLHRAAKAIVADHGGQVPASVDELEALPGVGPYTARAVAAIAFGKPVGAVDVNVKRVLGRIVAGGPEGITASSMQALADASVPHAPGRRLDACADGRRPAECAGRDDQTAPTARRSPGAPTRPACVPRWSSASPAQAAPAPRARVRIDEPLAAWPDRGSGRVTPMAGPAFDEAIGEHGPGAVRRRCSTWRATGCSMSARRRRASRRGCLATDARRAIPFAQVPTRSIPLPADDPTLATASLDELALRWADIAARGAISRRGDDRPSIAGPRHWGRPAASSWSTPVRPSRRRPGRCSSTTTALFRPVLVLAGSGNNGGDAFVAARVLAGWGIATIAVLDGAEREAGHRPMPPATGTGSTAWPRRRDPRPGRARRDPLPAGIDKAGVVVDALLGTGVRGRLRDPIEQAVERHRRARHRRRAATSRSTRPTALDLTPRRPVRPRRPRRPHRHLSSTQDRPSDPGRQGARRPNPRRPDRHPARGRPCLTSASPASARSCSSPPLSS